MKANKRYIRLINCLIATFCVLGLGVFVMLLTYKGPVLDFFIQFFVLMTSAYALKLKATTVPLDIDNPNLQNIEFVRVPELTGFCDLPSALYGVLAMNNEAFLQSFANAVGAAKNTGDRAALEAMLANPKQSMPVLMVSNDQPDVRTASSSVGSTISNPMKVSGKEQLSARAREIYATASSASQHSTTPEQKL